MGLLNQATFITQARRRWIYDYPGVEAVIHPAQHQLFAEKGWQWPREPSLSSNQSSGDVLVPIYYSIHSHRFAFLVMDESLIGEMISTRQMRMVWCRIEDLIQRIDCHKIHWWLLTYTGHEDISLDALIL